jgi:ABC-type amino acid transport substrate-binding protein
MTEEYPPYNYREKGELKGFAVDLMVRMLETVGADLGRDDIRLMPWSNAYNQTLNRDNTVLFAMSRTDAREDLFKWVGPIAVNRISLIAPKSKQIQIDSLEDARPYRIGAIRDDSGEALLRQGGIEKGKIERVANVMSMARMLAADRIDMAAYSNISFSRILKKNGLSPQDYEAVYVLDEVPAYYAFNNQIPDAVVQAFQRALDDLKRPPEGGGKSVHRQILDDYLQ